MKAQSNSTFEYGVLLPIPGILVYVTLYIVATLLYPGGSQADKNAAGFSWVNNYWCNLLSEYAINGMRNPARPFALAAQSVLCCTLAWFWYIFPVCMHFQKFGRMVIQFSGTASMTIAMFLFTDLHDMIINLSGLFGLIALTGTFIGLYRSKWYALLWYGALNLLLVALNNYVYYTRELIVYLPVIQKVSFLSFMVWLCSIDVMLYRKQRQARSL